MGSSSSPAGATGGSGAPSASVEGAPLRAGGAPPAPLPPPPSAPPAYGSMTTSPALHGGAPPVAGRFSAASSAMPPPPPFAAAMSDSPQSSYKPMHGDLSVTPPRAGAGARGGGRALFSAPPAYELVAPTSGTSPIPAGAPFFVSGQHPSSVSPLPSAEKSASQSPTGIGAPTASAVRPAWHQPPLLHLYPETAAAASSSQPTGSQNATTALPHNGSGIMSLGGAGGLNAFLEMSNTGSVNLGGSMAGPTTHVPADLRETCADIWGNQSQGGGTATW